jgi:hypothetical protein
MEATDPAEAATRSSSPTIACPWYNVVKEKRNVVLRE